MKHHILILIIAMLMSVVAHGQKPSSNTGTPLGVKQAHVRQLLIEMDQRFAKLAKALESSEPQHAERLTEALRQSKKMLLQHRVDQITQLLNDDSLDAATRKQAQLIADLMQLIEILTAEDDLDEALAEIDRLEQWKREIDKLIQKEKQHKQDAQTSADPDSALKQLDGHIAALKDLIKRQKKLVDDTQTQRTKGIEGLGKLADEQRHLRHQTQALTKALGDKHDKASPTAPSHQTKPGKAALSKASEHQHNAEKNLGKGKGKQAEDDAGRALDQMRKALHQLERKRSRIARLPKDHNAQLAREQEKTADKVGDLSKQMDEAGKSASQANPGSGSQSGQSQQTPGQQNVQQAQKQMKQASAKLEKQQPNEATDDQQKAIDQLTEAQKQIEQRLAQLREQMQEEALAALEHRFIEMLERQKPVTQATLDLDRARTSRPADESGEYPLTRPERLLCAKLAEEERAIAHLATKAQRIIIEDGSTVVFPRIVEQLIGDLEAAHDFCAREDSGSYTQYLQQQIEQTLEELIEAVRRAQQQQQQGNRPSGNAQQQDSPQEPLVPESAELKLLKSAQLRVNRSTTSFDQARKGEELSAPMAKEVNRIADRQDQVRQIAENLAENR